MRVLLFFFPFPALPQSYSHLSCYSYFMSHHNSLTASLSLFIQLCGHFLSLSWWRWTFCVWVLIGSWLGCVVSRRQLLRVAFQSRIELGFRCTLQIKDLIKIKHFIFFLDHSTFLSVFHNNNSIFPLVIDSNTFTIIHSLSDSHPSRDIRWLKKDMFYIQSFWKTWFNFLSIFTLFSAVIFFWRKICQQVTSKTSKIFKRFGHPLNPKNSTKKTQ